MRSLRACGSNWRPSSACPSSSSARPGPDTALTVRNAFSGGRRGGVWTAAGVAIGQAAWTFFQPLGHAHHAAGDQWPGVRRILKGLLG
ncbi:LysE family transporter [Nonomuraea sp. B12E4]|uniref:LysE family transporter n=1 Tax=Nonomuraea sp. B12E4 TaxID=3153564 RepID=UPI00325D6404